MEFFVGMHLLGERIYLMISNYAAYLEIDTRPLSLFNLKRYIFFNIDFEDKVVRIHLRRTFIVHM